MSEMMQAGLSVTAIGLGTVFVLLTALVGIVYGMSALTRAFAPEGVAVAAAETLDSEVTAAIAAAITRYRRNRQG